MRALTILTVLLSALLLCPGHAAAGTGDGSVAGSVPARGQGAVGPQAQARTEAKPAAQSDQSQGFPTLSLLAALGLGVIGLLWIRRHTAEL